MIEVERDGRRHVAEQRLYGALVRVELIDEGIEYPSAELGDLAAIRQAEMFGYIASAARNAAGQVAKAFRDDHVHTYAIRDDNEVRLERMQRALDAGVSPLSTDLVQAHARYDENDQTVTEVDGSGYGKVLARARR